MTQRTKHIDQLGRLVQVGSAGGSGVCMVRITGVSANNIYNARPIEFDDNGQPQLVGTSTMTVTNLAEPADATGQVSADTDAVALDLGGRWVVFLRQAGAAMFPAKVVSSQGSAVYTVREQSLSDAGVFSNATGTTNITAKNLAELSLGSGAAVDVDTIVLVTSIMDTGSPATVRYIFGHPCYAKYLS
jgi:hypothetical protein